MSYDLRFREEALKEWKRLDSNVRSQFKKKLIERLEVPCIPSARLLGSTHRYKIKLRGAGFRLVYEVHKQRLVVLVIAVGKRERNAVYRNASKR